MQPEPAYDVVWSGREGLTSYTGPSQLASCLEPTVADLAWRNDPQPGTRKEYLKAPPGGLVAHYRDHCGWSWVRIAAALHAHKTTVRRAYERWKSKA